MLPTASLQAFKDSSSSQTDRRGLPQQAAGQALAVARSSPSYSKLKCGERSSAGMSQAIQERIIQTLWSGMTTPYPGLDGSGDGSMILPTFTATHLPATGPSTVDEPVLVTESTIESSFETQSSPSTELDAVNDEDSLDAAEQSILIYVVPVALLVLMILLITFFVMHHKRKKSKQDELGSENVKSPIFEEDTPSVMEIEMEELDKWMNSMNKNGDCECLPTVREEEKESIANPSDGES
ncbi:transmembrane protein 154 isoform X1 [Parus major]|uniref:transmembrane protein 154 isoform X1 n=1 Tax=Parus major TaxID=9157 RepID=UPI0008F545B8|nr:transmembrane protein 154 isoform X1 [Parus major]